MNQPAKVIDWKSGSLVHHNQSMANKPEGPGEFFEHKAKLWLEFGADELGINTDID